ncbi:hypothetical protein [Polynucleobacter sp. MWH-P3-07-1]|uniref:hypothetical protein n=1 Tax=Polynucleobacter sp. MWH-P3-07-1 TaxID=1743173 RepID=UPI001BFD7116|nr:hypothetical protein [Polynucleobacter sp. MWH-P3-07-1]
MTKLTGLRLRVFLLFASCCLSALAFATPEEEAQLDSLDKIDQQLELQRDWAKYRWEKAQNECYKHYWVSYCLSSARSDYRKAIDPIGTQQVALHAEQRKIRESVKDQRDAQKIADRASPEKAAERAENKQKYEQKQKDAATRAADLEQRRKDAPKRSQENKAGTQLD